jgi:hypothetical protein
VADTSNSITSSAFLIDNAGTVFAFRLGRRRVGLTDAIDDAMVNRFTLFGVAMVSF